MLSVRNLVKTYKSKNAETVYALNDVSIDFASKGFVFLLGKSGSGKSTLLNTIGGLDKFDSGEIIIKGRSSKTFTESDFDSYRNTFIGFIFQEYNILENFTVEKNLELALELQGKKVSHEEVNKLLEQVDMLKYAKRKPNELSGGQKQRVAIARALIKAPEIIMADEPTGALDSNTGKQVMDTLKKLSKEKLVIVVSHDREFAEIYGDRIIELKDGKIISDVTKKEIETVATKSGIKVIDNTILYIKKGQEVDPTDMQKLTYLISKKSKVSDTFISFDESANKKLKEGAKITDDGNREKFVETTADDIDKKEYNPKSLTLIKSRLKFSDSLKMGASSLKYKVGKLIFTIILSFFAFTVFGIFDTLSCWDRASSVYEAMKMTGQTSVSMQKKEKGDYGNDQVFATDDDLAYFKEKYKDYTFVGSSSGGSHSSQNTIGEIYDTDETSDTGHRLNGYNNYYQKAFLSTYTHVTNEQIKNLGFSVKGSLPANENEIAISKHMAKNIILGSTKNSQFTTPLTEDTVLGKYISLYAGYNSSSKRIKIVGIVDDKISFEKYEGKTDDELQKITGLSDAICASWAAVGYVCESYMKQIIDNSYVDIYGYLSSSTSNNNFYKGNIYNTSSCLNIIESSQIYNGELYNFEYYQKDSEFFVKGSIENGSSYYFLYTDDCYYTYSDSSTSISKYDYDGKYLEPVFISEFKYSLDSNHIPTGFEKLTNARTNTLNFLMKKKLTYIKSGNINADGSISLSDNEVILRKDLFSDTEIESIKKKIDAGTLTYGMYKNYHSSDSSTPPIVSLKVVGLMKNIDSTNSREVRYIVSSKTEETIKNSVGSYNFILSNLKGSRTDEKLIKDCETFNSSGEKFTIQNEATMMLDMFNYIIIETAKVLVYIAIAFAVFAALLLMNFISTSISHKKREIGVLRALGARGSDVFGIFFNEALIIAFINFALSTVATFIACALINKAVINGLGVSVALASVGIRQIILLLCVSVGSAFLASFIPTMKISRKKPIDAINNR